MKPLVCHYCSMTKCRPVYINSIREIILLICFSCLSVLLYMYMCVCLCVLTSSPGTFPAKIQEHAFEFVKDEAKLEVTNWCIDLLSHKPTHSNFLDALVY